MRVRLIGYHGRVCCRHGAGRRRGSPGLHPRQGHRPARADRRGRRLARAPHRGGGAGGAGGRLPGRAARAAGQHRDQHHPAGASSPSINFPRQSVTDAGDIVRPFTLRGLSPDHTLVLLNGWRRHQTALVNNFTYGMGAGSSGVDLNAIPSSALDRIEVLRDGASAQYGSDAIAGVVNLVLKDGAFTPFVNGDVGRYATDDYPGRRHHGERERRLGHPARARLAGAVRRVPRPAADQPGVGRPVRGRGHGRHRRHRRQRPGGRQEQPGDQPNHHWGDGLEKDVLGFGNFRMPVNESGTTEVYAFGGYSHRDGSGNGFRRCAVTAPASSGTQLARDLPARLPADDRRHWLTDYSAAGGLRGVVVGLELRAGRGVRPQRFRLQHHQHAQRLAGPVSRSGLPCAPGAGPACSAPRTIPGSRTSCRSSRAGCCARNSSARSTSRKPVEPGPAGPGQPRVRRGVPARALRHPRRASWRRTSTGFHLARTATASRRAGSQVVPRLHARRRDRPAPHQLRASTPTPRPTCRQGAAPTWRRGSRTTATSARE